MFAEFAKASEAEIWTRVRRRYLTYLPKVGKVVCLGVFDDLNLQIYLGLGLVNKQPTLASIATKE